MTTSTNRIGTLFDLTFRKDEVSVYPFGYNPLNDSSFIYAYDPASARNTYSTSSIMILADNRDATPLISGAFNSAPLIGTDPILNNQQVGNFPSGSGYHWQWNGSKESFSFLHNGSGSTVFAVWSATGSATNNPVYNTNNVTTNNIGQGLTYDGLNQRLIFRINNASAPLVNLVTANNSVLSSSGHYFCARYLEGLTPNEIDIRLDGAQIYSSSSLVAPTGALSLGVFTIGKQTTGTSVFVGNIGVILIADTYLPDSKVLQVESYLRNRYRL